MDTWIFALLGLFIGGCIGLTIGALCSISREAEWREERRQEYEAAERIRVHEADRHEDQIS